MAGIITEKRKEELLTIQAQLNKLSECIQNVLDEKSSMREFAEALCKTPQELNNYINAGTTKMLSRAKILTASDIEQLLRDSESPSERLIRIILRTDELIILSLPEEDKIIEILNEKLNNRECEVIKHRFGFYGKPKTLEEVAKLYAITRDRIRQIEGSALRKLRNPVALSKLLPDYDLKMKELVQTQRMVDINSYLDAEVDKSKNVDSYIIPIEMLNLSTRTYRTLKRAGVNYIGDLVKYTITDLKRIRNLGNKSIDELIDALKQKYNIVITDPYKE